MVRWVYRPRTLARKLALVWCELPPQRPAAGEIKFGNDIALAADATVTRGTSALLAYRSLLAPCAAREPLIGLGQ